MIRLILLTAFLSGCGGITLVGGVGVRDTTHWDADIPASVTWGAGVGEVRIQAQYDENFYSACTHVSGLNDEEGDGGLNYCSTGFIVNF